MSYFNNFKILFPVLITNAATILTILNENLQKFENTTTTTKQNVRTSCIQKVNTLIVKEEDDDDDVPRVISSPKKLNETSASITMTNVTNTLDKDTVAICAIQKGAMSFIDEWIDYNLAIGFDKIYLYDNSPDFELQEWHKEKNYTHVDITHFPGKVKQLPAYDDCIERIKGEVEGEKPKHKWIAFIDLDEFIVLKKHETILQLLQEKCDGERIGGLALNWYLFGYNNQTKYRPLPLTKRFQMRANETDDHVKVILRTDQIGNGGSFKNPHSYRYKNWSLTFDTSGRWLLRKDWININGPSDVAVIHHYQTKSLEEFMSRCKRGRADIQQVDADEEACKSEEEILEQWKNETQVFDGSAWQILKTRVPKYRIFYEDTII